ncbi:MAG TPA: DUF4234 domain-containing protein [Polyangiaceae bacterium]|nr:DUF4234 domain-containing protein [Polyangiaceae bacterium]
MSNPYAPPVDSGEDAARRPIVSDGRAAQFFEVAPGTLVGLYLITFGIYGVYWFYKHWAVQKRARGLNISPLARGIFAIFFVHKLFKMIDQTARATGITPKWDAASQATLYVIIVIVARVVTRLSDTGVTLLAGLGLVGAAVIPLWSAQRVANQANGRALNADSWIE